MIVLITYQTADVTRVRCARPSVCIYCAPLVGWPLRAPQPALEELEELPFYLRDNGPRDLSFVANPTRGLDASVDSSWAVRFSCSGCLAWCLVFYHYGVFRGGRH